MHFFLTAAQSKVKSRKNLERTEREREMHMLTEEQLKKKWMQEQQVRYTLVNALSGQDSVLGRLSTNFELNENPRMWLDF